MFTHDAEEKQQYRPGAHCPSLMPEEVERKDCALFTLHQVKFLGWAI